VFCLLAADQMRYRTLTYTPDHADRTDHTDHTDRREGVSPGGTRRTTHAAQGGTRAPPARCDPRYARRSLSGFRVLRCPESNLRFDLLIRSGGSSTVSAYAKGRPRWSALAKCPPCRRL